MHDLPPQSSPPSGLRPPRRTARLRLTILYGAVCLVFGATLLTVTYLLTWGTVIPAETIMATPRSTAAAGQSSVGPSTQQENQAQPQNGADQIAVDRKLLLARSGLALVIVSAAAVGAGWLLAGRVLRPLSTITAAARRISASSLHERLALDGPDDELKELGDTLDGLFTRLEASFDAQRGFAANASHELRTPLTRERALLEVTLADPASTVGTWQDVSRDLLAFNAEQDRLIEALLTLASSEAGLSQHEPLDLAAITSAALAVPRPGISCLGLDVRASIQPAILDGDPLLVRQLVTNLIDNAVHHNIQGGDVHVATGTSNGRAVLSVANSGQAIPPTEVDRLLQPFQRLGPRRARRDGGHGLGLSIVRAIATAHGADITLQPRSGGGLAVDVTFPLTARVTDPLAACQARAGLRRHARRRSRTGLHAVTRLLIVRPIVRKDLLEVPMAVDPAFDTKLGLSGGNGASRRYDAGSGYGRAAGPLAMLAADADRERAIDVLKAGFAEGRLTRAEHDDRTARVYAARTYRELGALIADLPAGPLGHPAHHPAAGYPPRQMAQPATNSMAVAALACGIGEFLTLGLTAIPAIVLGHAARRQVRKTGQRGDGMALAGLTIGWIGLLTAIIAGLIIAASVSGHSSHSVFAHPILGAPGGPLQGG